MASVLLVHYIPTCGSPSVPSTTHKESQTDQITNNLSKASIFNYSSSVFSRWKVEGYQAIPFFKEERESLRNVRCTEYPAGWIIDTATNPLGSK